MMRDYLLNSVLYFVGWFFLVHSAAEGFAWEGIVVALAIILVHLFRSQYPISELVLIIYSLVLGFVIETFFLTCGILSFSSPNHIFSHFAPVWLAAMYALFATTINNSLARFGDNYMTAAIFGFAGSICSYYAGYRLGAVEFLIPKAGSLLVIGSVWFFFLPSLFRVNQAIIKFRNHHEY